MKELNRLTKDELIKKIQDLDSKFVTLKNKFNENHRYKHFKSSTTNEFFRNLPNNSSEAVAIINNNNKIHSANNHFTTLFQYSQEEIIGKNLNDLILPKRTDEEKVEHPLNISNTEAFHIITKLRRKDNSLLQVIASKYQILAYEDIFTIVRISNITNKSPFKNHENININKRLKLYKYTVETYQNPIYWVNEDGEIIFANKSARDLLGYTEKEINSKTVFDIDKTITYPKWNAHWEKIKEDKFTKTESYNKRKDGTVFPVEVLSNYICFEGIEIEIAHVADISEQKKTEIDLEESEFRFRKLADNIQDGIAIIENGKIVYVNQNILSIFNIGKSDISNTKLSQFIKNRNLRTLQESPFKNNVIANDSRSIHTECWIKTYLGQEKYIHINYISKELNNSNFRFIIISDITHRKNYEVELEQEKNLLNEVIKNNPYSIGLFDNEGNIIKVNKAFEELIGINSQSKYCLYDDPILKKNNYHNNIKQIKNKETIIIQELKYNPNEISQEFPSKNLFLRSMIFPIFNINDKLNQIVVIHQDITAMKFAEKSLIESEVLFRSLVSTTASGLLIYQGLKLKYMNRAAQLITGYSLEDIQEMDFLDIIHPDHWQTIEKESLNILKDENTLTGYELKIVAKDGQEKWIDIRGNNIIYKGKKGGIFTFFDISSRKIAEQALNSSEEKYRLIFDQSPLAIVNVDKESNIVDCNSKFCEFVNLKKESIIGFNLLKNIKDEHVKKAIKDSLYKGEVSSYEGVYDPVLKKDAFHISLHTKPIFDESNELIGGVGLIEDITERFKTEKLLKNALSEKDVIFKTLPDTIFVMSTQGSILEIHGSAANILMIPNEEIIGKSIYSIFPSWIADIILSKIKTAQETSKLQTFEHFIKLQNTSKYLEVRLASLNKKEVLAIIRDITYRKTAELKVKEINKMVEQERNLFINGPVMIFKWRDLQKWHVEYVSPNINKILGYNPSSLTINRNSFQDIVFEGDLQRISDEIRAKIENALTYFETEPFRIKSKHGNIFWVNSYINQINENDSVKYLGYVVDVTDRKLAEEELIIKNKEMENFIYVTSHDIRSPLVNIQGFSNEIEHSIKTLEKIITEKNSAEEIRKDCKLYFSEDIPESLSFIYKSTEKMENLLVGLLKLSRMGRLSINIENIDMNKLCREVASNFEYKLQDRNIDLLIKILPNCLADRNMVNQVVSNFLDNAIKYLKPNIKGNIIIEGFRKKNHSIYSIEDNGIGIKPQDQLKIFEIFERFNKNIEGEGIGLAMVKKIIERHKGEVWVESEFDKGSKFFFSILNE